MFSNYLFSLFVLLPMSASAQSIGGKPLPNFAREFLVDTLLNSDQPAATVTSTSRSASDQARIMFDKILQHGVAAMRNLYGDLGNVIITLYEEEVKGLSESEISDQRDRIIKSMSKLVADLIKRNPNRRELMHIHSEKNYAFDVGPISLVSSSFRAELQNHPEVVRFFPPGGAETAFHIELRKNSPTISGVWSGECKFHNSPGHNVTIEFSRGEERYNGQMRAAGLNSPLEKIEIKRKRRKISFTARAIITEVKYSGTINVENSKINLISQFGSECILTKQ